MNVKTFKNLIKEAVAEAVREELHAILNESKPTKSLQENKTFNFTSNDVSTVGDVRAQLRNMFGFEQPTISNNGVPLVVDSANENPFANFIMDAALNMTAQDKAGLNNLG